MTIDLLDIELDTLWTRDQRGRLVADREPHGGRAPHLVVAQAVDGRSIAFGTKVPDSLVERARQIFDSETGDTPGAPPADRRYRSLFEDWTSPLETSFGPSFIVDTPPTTKPDGAVFTSESSTIDDVRKIAPAAAVASLRAPWVMVVVEKQLASMCSTVRLTDSAAEAGVWTSPALRGRGHAAGATAEWARLLWPTGRLLFYSTWEQNRSSRAVASRLGLREIGWTWKLKEPTSPPRT